MFNTPLKYEADLWINPSEVVLAEIVSGEENGTGRKVWWPRFHFRSRNPKDGGYCYTSDEVEEDLESFFPKVYGSGKFGEEK
jgi:hypothetical protein